MAVSTSPGAVPVSLTPPLPAALQVEVTSACNLRCAMCLVRYRPPVNRLAGAMPLPMLRRIVDDVPGLRELTLQGLGEPLLAPDLLEMVRYAKARGVRVGFNSNATLLTRRRADELVAAGLDWLHVSLDGADRATFEAIRDGADFDRVVSNLAGLVAAKRAAGSDTPWVRVVFVAMRRNVSQLPDLVALLGRIGVNELRVQNLSHSFADTDPAGAYREIREYAAQQALWTGARSTDECSPGAASGSHAAVAERAYAAAREVAREYAVALRLPAPPDPGREKTPRRPGCGWPWDSAYVTSAGVVQPCCMVMGDDRVSVGRLASPDGRRDEGAPAGQGASAGQGFAEIWAGEQYQEFRRRLRDGDPPDVCRGCALYHGAF